MQKECRCEKCGKFFLKLIQNSNLTAIKNVIDQEPESHVCYNCTLERITGGFPPEAGDFNSARICSGEMTEREQFLIQEELYAVEQGVSSGHDEYSKAQDYYEEENYGGYYYSSRPCDPNGRY